MSEDISSYCSAHDEWLIMKLCMYVGYHDANNVSNFGGDPVTQLHFKKRLYNYLRCFMDMALHNRYAVTVSAAVARSCVDGTSMEGYTSLSTALVSMPFTLRDVGDVFLFPFFESISLMVFQVFLISDLYFSNVIAKNCCLAAHNNARS